MTISPTSFDAIASMAEFARNLRDPYIIAEVAKRGDAIASAAQEDPPIILTADFVHGFISASTLSTTEARLTAAGLALRFMDGTL